MNFYVYRIDDPITKQFYFGSKGCKCLPEENTDYIGSMKTWKPEDKTRLIKTILKTEFNSMSDAIYDESKRIEKYIDNPLNENYHIPDKGFHTNGLTGEKSHMFGKHHSEETREKIRVTQLGKTLSKEHKQKLSKSHTGKTLSEKTKKLIGKSFSKPVLQYTKDGKFIKEWKSGMDVVRELGINHSYECCNGKQKTSGGFKWKYKNK